MNCSDILTKSVWEISNFSDERANKPTLKLDRLFQIKTLKHFTS